MATTPMLPNAFRATAYDAAGPTIHIATPKFRLDENNFQTGDILDLDPEAYRAVENWCLSPPSLITSLDTYVDLALPEGAYKASHRRSSFEYRSGYPKRRRRRFRGRVLAVLKENPLRRVES